jgi:hypothetical protein
MARRIEDPAAAGERAARADNWKAKNPGEIWVATLGTEHYGWLGIGRTKEEARQAIWRRWRKHMDKVKAAATRRREPFEETYHSIDEIEDYYGIHYYNGDYGDGFRDGEK